MKSEGKSKASSFGGGWRGLPPSVLAHGTNGQTVVAAAAAVVVRVHAPTVEVEAPRDVRV